MALPGRRPSRGGDGRAPRIATTDPSKRLWHQPDDQGAHVLLAMVLRFSGQAKAALAHADATKAMLVHARGEPPGPVLRSALHAIGRSAALGMDTKAVVGRWCSRAWLTWRRRLMPESTGCAVPS